MRELLGRSIGGTVGSSASFFAALAATAALISLPVQGVLAVIVDVDTSGVISFESGTFTGAPPPAADVQTAMVSGPSDCATAKYSDGGLSGATFAVDVDNTTGQYDVGYICVTNAGGQSAELSLAHVTVADSHGELTCEAGEPAAGDTSDCESSGELGAILLFNLYDTDCDDATSSVGASPFIGVASLDSSFDPTEICYVALRWIDDATVSENEWARAQTDYFRTAFEFRVDDGT